jgi:hypothetical protein
MLEEIDPGYQLTRQAVKDLSLSRDHASSQRWQRFHLSIMLQIGDDPFELFDAPPAP